MRTDLSLPERAKAILVRMNPCAARLPARLHGRRWFAAYLVVLALALVPISVTTVFFDMPWLSVTVLGIPCLLSAGLCFAIAFGEMVVRIELRDDGFAIRLPSFRAWLPVWPVQRLNAKWGAVTEIQSSTVHGRMFFLPFDYVLHRIATQRGSVVLLEPLPGFFRDVRGMSFGLPVREIMGVVRASAARARYSSS